MDGAGDGALALGLTPGDEAAPARVAASLRQICEGPLRREVPEPVAADLGSGRVQLTLPVDIDIHVSRRLHRCLEDSGFDRVQAHMTVRKVTDPAE